MSDEVENTPGEGTEQPTVAEPAANETAGDAPASADTTTGAPEHDTTTVAPPARPGVTIPRWVAVLVGVLVVVLGSGAIGYAIGHNAGGSDDHRRVMMPGGDRGGPFGRYGPQLPNGGGTRNGPNGDQLPGIDPRTGPSAPTTPSTPSTPSANGAFLGVAVQAGNGGVRITTVAGGSPADDAGLKAGDVITAVDGKSVTAPADLVTQVQSHSSGDQVTIAYTRDGNAATAKVTLGSRADSGTRS